MKFLADFRSLLVQFDSIFNLKLTYLLTNLNSKNSGSVIRGILKPKIIVTYSFPQMNAVQYALQIYAFVSVRKTNNEIHKRLAVILEEYDCDISS